MRIGGATPLAQVVHKKTSGNPFFAIQFFAALAEERLLTFDRGDWRWHWDIGRIQAKGYTDNVVDLMVGKLNRLPLQTQKALQQLACLGNSSEFTTLSIVHGKSEDELNSDLWEAMRLEYVVRVEGLCKFVHDRVQEAAYSLIPEQLRAEAHLRIGRLLNAHTALEKREESIFEIVNQLNRGAALITSREERDQIAELNLIAGRRAKASTAYISALNYQAVSSEIVLEKLIDTLMRTAIEHAGAERGLLILPRGVEQRVEAEASTSGDTIIVRLREAFVAEAEAPESIVHYVMPTQESVILDDASAKNSFSADAYIRRHHARSILCLPLINQAKLIGVLYLENNLTPLVFTQTRIAVLKLLASQAAISLENSRLYRDLEEREAKIRRLVDANVIGIYIGSVQGEIIEANEAFLHMVGYSREDLVSRRLRWTDLTPAEWRGRDEQALSEVKVVRSNRTKKSTSGKTAAACPRWSAPQSSKEVGTKVSLSCLT